MATLALSVAGAAIGGAVLPGLSLLGGTLTGAGIGRALGAMAGAYIDGALFGASGQTKQSSAGGNRYQVTSAAEGADIPRLYGRARLGGQIIWATNLLRRKVKQKSGKGFGSSSSASGPQYEFYANFAVGLCEGEISRIGRVWADGEEIDLSQYTHRVYRGTEDQAPDSLIIAKEGADNAPAYRGLAYVVFENMKLDKFGDRIPQLNFEAFRAVDETESRIKAVTMIPAASEFIYDTVEVLEDTGFFGYRAENRNTTLDGTDFQVSLDDLEQSLPECGAVSLFVSWFGDDLRCGDCLIRPKVERNDKTTKPYAWTVAGVSRSAAAEMSRIDNRPAYGGTPSDASVTRAIQEMHARGLDVAFTPFLMMDVPGGNTKTDPYTGASSQPAYPWRGRITCHPAPGQPGSPDGSTDVNAQVNAFVSQYRDFVLHYANLCADAGGVEIFVIGTEMRGMTWVRNGTGSYPFVTALKTLAADVSAILPAAKITYAADWSEWFGHQPSDGSGDVYFHLDPLWSDANIDAIGIDNYWPLSDWRDGNSHADYQAGWRDPRNLAYLKSNIEGGEGYDWYYGSDSDREDQVRTPITDGAGKPWVFRYKDIRNWWLNEHYNRPGGTESATPTAWVPQSKPFWFMEFGCPAVDRGANQPNVFFDPKSAESFLPYFSRGYRDDLMQRRYLQAMVEYYDPAAPGFEAAQNPESTVYAGRMVDPARLFVYTWDARPFPAFPNNLMTWTDGDNYARGHWITGRMGTAPLAQTVAQIFTDSGFFDFEVSGLSGVMQGYRIDQIASVRDMLQPLETAFFFDTIESGGLIRCKHRGADGPVLALTRDDLVESGAGSPVYELTRSQETELARSAKITYSDPEKDYETGTAEARRLAGSSTRVSEATLPIILNYDDAVQIAETLLHESWAAREKLSASLPPSKLHLEPSDLITVTAGGITADYRITECGIGEAIEVTAQSVEAHVYDSFGGASRSRPPAQPIIFGEPAVAFMDLPLITGAETPHAGRFAAYSQPYGGVAVYRSPSNSGFTLNALIQNAGRLGETMYDFYPGPASRFDKANILRVRLYTGELDAVPDILLLGGANLAAIENADGEWEVLQFGGVSLISAGVYDLTRFLRGQFGTEGAMRSPVAAGARFVMLDEAVVESAMTLDERGLAFNWKAGPAPYDIGHPAYLTRTKTFRGVGLRPYSPVHIRAKREGNGDLTLTWVRRDRIGADNWEQTEVPMSEATESYTVEIMDGASVKRTLTASGPSAAYTSAQQTADWGGPPSSVTVRVCQMSQIYGRGSTRTETVYGL